MHFFLWNRKCISYAFICCLEIIFGVATFMNYPDAVYLLSLRLKNLRDQIFESNLIRFSTCIIQPLGVKKCNFLTHETVCYLSMIDFWAFCCWFSCTMCRRISFPVFSTKEIDECTFSKSWRPSDNDVNLTRILRIIQRFHHKFLFIYLIL